MPPRSGSSSSQNSFSLTDREQEIAKRVRRSLHLSASMPLVEVKEQFQHSAAWRRERMGLAVERLGNGLWTALRPRLQSLWGWIRIRWSRLRKGEDPDPPEFEGKNGLDKG